MKNFPHVLRSLELFTRHVCFAAYSKDEEFVHSENLSVMNNSSSWATFTSGRKRSSILQELGAGESTSSAFLTNLDFFLTAAFLDYELVKIQVSAYRRGNVLLTYLKTIIPLSEKFILEVLFIVSTGSPMMASRSQKIKLLNEYNNKEKLIGSKWRRRHAKNWDETILFVMYIFKTF